MGGEFGQWQEWNCDSSIEWHLLGWPLHQGLLRWVRDLNTAYRAESALHQLDCNPQGFEWIDANDYEQSVLTFLRRGKDPRDQVLVALNFTPVPRHQYQVGVSVGGQWEEILNSDAGVYCGSGQGNLGGVVAIEETWHGRPYLLNLTLPPLGIVVLRAPGEISG
jgi:1,4-alpha-glucan branching enzyme